MKRFFNTIAFAAVLVGAGYYFRVPLSNIVAQLEVRYLPCRSPIAYSIGQFDTQFGISKADFLSAIAQAEAVWEGPAKKDLFAYEPEGALTVNLIFDTRQQTTVTLQKLGIALSDSRASYDALKARYVNLQAEYLQQKSQYEAALATFNERQAAYNAEVKKTNQRGGANKETFSRLNEEKQALSAEFERLNQMRLTLNTDVETINALAAELNRLVGVLNLNVDAYNAIGATQGEEFEEGLYRSSSAGRAIDIYQFDSRARLVRVLAHELGHALGLEHVDDSKAIMYRLNQGTNEEATATDLAELKEQCGIE